MARIYYALKGGGAYAVENGAFGQKALGEVFGDGSDGSITDSSNTTRTGQILQTTDYTLTSGTTLDVNGTVIIHAQDYIEIEGTIDANSSEAGGSGGSRTFGTGNPGENGPDGRYIGGTGAGGAGGSSSNGEDGLDGSFACGAGGGGRGAYNGGSAGGDGGDGTGDREAIPFTGNSVDSNTYLANDPDWDEFYNDTPNEPAGGGAGGGSGGEDEGGANQGRAGGDGGRGGGLIILVAPEIRGSGLVDAGGEPGQDGEDSIDSGGDQPASSSRASIVGTSETPVIPRSSITRAVSSGSNSRWITTVVP